MVAMGGKGPLLRSSFELRLNIWFVMVLTALLLPPKYIYSFGYNLGHSTPGMEW